MDKEQRKRMAWKGFVQEDEGQADIEYLVEVSGDRVEIHRIYEEEWENEDGTGPDEQRECWVMSKESLKQLIATAQWCIEKSEKFEATHPREEKQA